ncbi:methyltransferase [Bacillus sp. JCM 19045]|nr:methyltransferase [Bacillus sp. JCM 19045]
MSYTHFAQLYDQLMGHVDYNQWLNYMKQTLKRENLSGLSVLDLGCGTGELLVRLKQAGGHVTGVDLSEDMLAIAQKKLTASGFNCQLLQGDMSELDAIGSFDVVSIFCDSLNYLSNENEVKKTFANCFNLINDGGWLLFDVHSPYKINQFIDATFAEVDDEISYIWNSFQGEEPLSIEHELTFFVKQKNGSYDRLEELHKERSYAVHQYKTWLKQAGFLTIQVTADFSMNQPSETSERLFFCLSKKEAGL